MNYFLAYQRLVAKATARVCPESYVERHHILKSFAKSEKILAMRADGKKYSDIMQTVGCSIGFVSKVVRNAEIS